LIAPLLVATISPNAPVFPPAVRLNTLVNFELQAGRGPNGAFGFQREKLYDYIKLLPDGDISIKLMDNHWVQIRAGRSNSKMVGMARANFPQVPEFPASGAVKISVGFVAVLVSA
jgi:hypothetical protein